MTERLAAVFFVLIAAYLFLAGFGVISLSSLS